MPVAGADRGDGDTDDLRTPLLKKASSNAHSLSTTATLLFQNWFMWEILSALLAVLSLVAIVSVLAAYDSSSLPDWPSAITINSVISFFATVGKLSVTAAVGASISQSKWLWYKREPRQLQDLQMFDSATRGPWGALALVLAVKAKSQASIGALIIILMLLFDPFLQQVVIYPDRLVPSDEPSNIARAQRYDARSHEGLPLPSVLDLSMKAAIYSGIFDVSDTANGVTKHHCSTGNCTWDEFPSLAICSKCSNITSFIEESWSDDGRYKLTLPGGPTILGFGGQINTSVTSISSDLEEVEPSVLQFSSLIFKTMNNSGHPSAWECVLSYCVNTYSAAVRDGKFQQHIQDSWLNNSASHSQGSDLIYRPPASIVNMTGNYAEFRVADLAASAMNSFMSAAFTGNGGINSSRSGSAFSSDVIQALYDTDDYRSRVANLATSMTNNIRQQNDSEFGPFRGLAYKSQTYVHVRWAWLSYPAILILLTIVFLSGTIIENARCELRVWGASNIALLFHGQGLPLDDIGHVPINTISQMTEKATAVEVRLTKANDDEWKLIEA